MTIGSKYDVIDLEKGTLDNRIFTDSESTKMSLKKCSVGHGS